MQGSYLKQLSVDHTTYNWLLQTGQSEAAKHCNRSEIISCFGGGNPALANNLIVQSLTSELPETILITSDGIHDYMDIDTIEDSLSSESDEMSILNLMRLAESSGSKDDKSIIIIRKN